MRAAGAQKPNNIIFNLQIFFNPSILNLKTKTDCELVTLTLQNPKFYGALIERYEKPLTRYLQRIAGLSQPEIEDLLQVIFLKAYQNLNGFKLYLKFSSWLYRIAHNEVISNFRFRKARPTVIDLNSAAVTPFLEFENDFKQKLDQKLLKKAVQAVLQKIDFNSREVLLLRFLEGKSYQEISDILRKPPGTIAALLNRAKKKFRQLAKQTELVKFLN